MTCFVTSSYVTLLLDMTGQVPLLGVGATAFSGRDSTVDKATMELEESRVFISISGIFRYLILAERGRSPHAQDLLKQLTDSLLSAPPQHRFGTFAAACHCCLSFSPYVLYLSETSARQGKSPILTSNLTSGQSQVRSHSHISLLPCKC